MHTVISSNVFKSVCVYFFSPPWSYFPSCPRNVYISLWIQGLINHESNILFISYNLDHFPVGQELGAEGRRETDFFKIKLQLFFKEYLKNLNLSRCFSAVLD